MKSIQIIELAKILGAEVFPEESVTSKEKVTGLSPIKGASETELTFLTDKKFAHELEASKAKAVIVGEIIPGLGMVQLVHKNPYLALAQASQFFHPVAHSFSGVSEQATIDATAQIGDDVTIYPYAYIGPRAAIGKGSVIYPFTYVGAYSTIGEDCILYPHTVVMDKCTVGDRVILNAGAVLGGDGFGFAPGKEKITKIPQIGKVVIEDDVEIGSGSTIDRATFDQTIIKRGTKIDSHVHIGHNVEVGEHTIICGMVGISGSSKVGSQCILAGQVGLSNGITVGDRVILAGKTGVTKDIKKPGTYGGFPALPVDEWYKQQAIIKRLPDLLERIKMLEKKLEEVLENK